MSVSSRASAIVTPTNRWRTHVKKFLLAPVLALSLAAVTPAFADDNGNRPNVPPEQWMSVDDVTQKLTSQGFQVRKIEADDGSYQFEGTNADGDDVQARVHPGTGEILRGDDD
jgi:hypothetical protein